MSGKVIELDRTKRVLAFVATCVEATARTLNTSYMEVFSRMMSLGKLFTEYDEEWLDFIVESRLGNKPWQQFDYIEGGVANDRIIDTINLYMSDLMPRDVALGRLAEHRPNNQMCILNQTIIDNFLKYNGEV